MNDRAAQGKASRFIEFLVVICFLALVSFVLAVISGNLVEFLFGAQNLKPQIGLPILFASFIAPFSVYFYLRTNQGKTTLVSILRSPSAKAIDGAISSSRRFLRLVAGPVLSHIFFGDIEFFSRHIQNNLAGFVCLRRNIYFDIVSFNCNCDNTNLAVGSYFLTICLTVMAE